VRGLKKINFVVGTLKKSYPQEKGQIRLYFEDEASFGRISEPKYCWCAKGVRPVVHSQRVREYREVFGAVAPWDGEFVYAIEEKEEQGKRKRGRPKKGEVADSLKPKPKEKGRKSRLFNKFLQQLSDKHPNDEIVCCLDGAWWHRSQYTKVPDNIYLVFIPPYTPEMNPIEQIWREIRTLFGNKNFNSIADVIATLHTTIAAIPPETFMSITQRDWIMNPNYWLTIT